MGGATELVRWCLWLAVVGGAIHAVHGHGGVFHAYPSTPEASNFIRYKVGSCKPWVELNATAKPNSATSSMLTIAGNTTLWVYLYKNCTDSLTTCVEVNLQFTDQGKPVVGLNVTGYGHVESCAAGGGAKYKLDPTVTDEMELNHTYVWFNRAKTNDSGRIWGQGANDGAVDTKIPGGLASYILYNLDTSEPLACCDWSLTGPPDTNWTTKLAPGSPDCPSEEDGANSTETASTPTAANTTSATKTVTTGGSKGMSTAFALHEAGSGFQAAAAAMAVGCLLLLQLLL